MCIRDSIRVELDDNKEIKLSKEEIPQLEEKLKNLINKTIEIDNFEGMLLE